MIIRKEQANNALFDSRDSLVFSESILIHGRFEILRLRYRIDLNQLTEARFRRRTFHEPNLIRIKADPNYLDRLK